MEFEFANECDQTDCGFKFKILKNDEVLYFLYVYVNVFCMLSNDLVANVFSSFIFYQCNNQ